MGNNKDRIADAAEDLVEAVEDAGSGGGALASSNADAAAAQAVTALSDAIRSTNSRQERTTGRVSDETRALATRDSTEQKTSDVGGEERAMIENLSQQSIGYGNNKTLSDVGSHLAFDRSLTSLQSTNPLAIIATRLLSDGATHSKNVDALHLEHARDAGVIKHLAGLDAINIRNDLAARGMLRDESSIARGQQRDQDSIATVLVTALGAMNPIIIERLRDDQQFRTAFVTLLIQALQGATGGDDKK